MDARLLDPDVIARVALQAHLSNRFCSSVRVSTRQSFACPELPELPSRNLARGGIAIREGALWHRYPVVVGNGRGLHLLEV